jgi:hypothetical protein
MKLIRTCFLEVGKIDTTEKAKHVLEGNGITIPFPQRDVHFYNTSE